MTIADRNKMATEGIEGSFLDVSNEIVRLTASRNQKLRMKNQLSKNRSGTIDKEKKTEIEVTDIEEKDQVAVSQDDSFEKQCNEVNIETSRLKLESATLDATIKECDSKIVKQTDLFHDILIDEAMETLDMNHTSINQALQMSMSSAARTLRGDNPSFFPVEAFEDSKVGEDMPPSRPDQPTNHWWTCHSFV